MNCWPTSRSSVWRRRGTVLALTLAVAFGAAPAALRAQTAAAGGEPWTLVIPRDQAIRMQRTFREVTPDAPVQGQMQFQQGVNPWAQLLLYAVAAAVANKTGRDRAAGADEVLVSTDASVGSAVAMNDTATVKKFGTQEEASVALAPYAEALKGTTLHQLIGREAGLLQARGWVLAEGAAPDAARQMHVAPKFVFAADQRSVHVDAAIGFGALTPGAAEAPDARQRASRVLVHSAAGEGFDITDHWLKDDAQELRRTLAALVLTAVEIAAARQQGAKAVPADAVQRTYRFRAGAENTYIRGKLVEATCAHVLLEALQGHWVALPASSVRDQELLPSSCRKAG